MIAPAQTHTNGTTPHNGDAGTAHFLHYGAEVEEIMGRMPWTKVAAIGDAIVSAWVYRRSVFIFGNGGSSATAQHMAADFSKNTTLPGERRLRSACLSDNTALFSALANDHGYAEAFADQIAVYANPGDVAIAISASGNSANVLAAMKRASEMEMLTIGITGFDGGQLARMAQYSVTVPSDNIEQVEDFHMILVHMLTSYVRNQIRALQTARAACAT